MRDWVLGNTIVATIVAIGLIFIILYGIQQGTIASIEKHETFRVCLEQGHLLIKGQCVPGP